MSIVVNGNTVNVHYRGTFTDGVEFDNSHIRGTSLNFTIGAGEMIPGFENAILGMGTGETKSFTLNPDESYGPHHPEAVQVVAKELFPPDFEFKLFHSVQSTTDDGRPVVAKIVEETPETVTLDFNHPLAGKELHFEVELVSFSDTTPGE